MVLSKYIYIFSHLQPVHPCGQVSLFFWLVDHLRLKWEVCFFSFSVFLVNGTDQLHWQRQTISEKMRADTESVLVKLGRRDHTGLCYVDNIELHVRRGGNKK